MLIIIQFVASEYQRNIQFNIKNNLQGSFGYYFTMFNI